MNRKERRAQGVRGKKGDEAITNEAIRIARDLSNVHKHDEARELYLKILKFDPENEIALLDLGIQYVRENDIEKAEDLVRKTLRLNDKNCPATTVLAIIRMAQSDLKESMRLVDKALKLNPSYQIFNRIGVLYMDAGKMDLAEKYLSESVRQKPDYIEGLYHLKQIRKFTQEEIDGILKIEKDRQLSLEEKIMIEFVLGNALMDIGKAEEGFPHLAEGNFLKRATYTFNLDNVEKYFDSMISLFNEDFVKRMRIKQPVTKHIPIFIVGLPRSGSTLADQIISSHPDVSSMGEAKVLAECIPVFPNEEVPNHFGPTVPTVTRKMLEAMDLAMLDEVAQKYRSKSAQFAKNTNHVIDKMLFNFTWVGLLRLAFPECKIVHTQRDLVDTGLSMWKLLFSDDIPWTCNLVEMGRYMKAYQKLMAHWHKVFPGEIYDLSYEAMVADQEGESRKLLEFCGLSWDERVLNFHETDRSVLTASATQVRKPIYKDSVKKWKKYERQLKPLIDTLGIQS
jgi:tetratricopeptide (TPR) repeat protein